MHEEALIHGTCLAIGTDGVLLVGKPGSGKSDLALRLIDQQGLGLSGKARSALLVADDQVVIRKIKSALIASAPASLKGKLEIRGLGIAELAVAAETRLRLAVRLTPAGEIERLPDLGAARMDVLGIGLPLILLDPGSASAPARLRAALDQFVQG
ncbi:MAG: HPr kinase/phosphatase C-terminal domain-containing protein [Aestuariivirga sp.]|uniref:HPr kinase/phosphorylase n=1 Tax=Aestuariivirga sp. TaxID=2650926 RepID=UPI0025C5B48C|nr:HPr kinase/phosphatase C-terminal domain-containing protein [Aestuariivirga sp.]MCA3561190.1 HPr kinase/phosphatase C-terminal domain-containing protein [Aestuariivirga sp.]